MTLLFLCTIAACIAVVGATAYDLGAPWLSHIAIRIHYTGRRGE